MRHFVQVHRVGKYGKPVPPADRFVVYTNKADELAAFTPAVVWLVSSERSFYGIAWRFEAEGISSSDNPDFKYSVIGRKGRVFDPPLQLTKHGLALLVACTNDFRFGFSELDEETAAELERIVGS